MIDVVQSLEQLDSSLKSYVALYDADALADQIRRVKGLKLEQSSLHQFNQRDKEYVAQLDITNRLWFINGILNELAIVDTVDDESHDDWHFIDLVSAVGNSHKLKAKLEEFEAHIAEREDVSGIAIIRDIQQRQQALDTKLRKLVALTDRQFFQVEEGSITVHHEFNGQTLSEFLDSVDQVAATMGVANTLVDWSTLIQQWTERILPLVEQGKGILRFVNDPEVNRLSFLTEFDLSALISDIKPDSEAIEKYIFSLDSLVSFIDDVVGLAYANRKVSNKLKQSLAKPILSSLKTQIFSRTPKNVLISLFTDSHARLRAVLQKLSGPGWFNAATSSIDTWIEDPMTYWIDTEFELTIAKMRDYWLAVKAGKLDFSKLTVNDIAQTQDTKPQTKPDSTPEPKVQKQEDEWNAKWEDDDDEEDGWKEEIDLDIDSVKEEPKEQPQTKEDEDGWDDWNEWDDDEKKPAEPKATQPAKQPESANKSEASGSHYKTSQVPGEIFAIYEDFLGEFDTLKRNHVIPDAELAKIRHEFILRFKPFAQACFATVSRSWNQFYPSPVLLYNDFGKLLELAHSKLGDQDLLPILRYCQELNTRFVNSLIFDVHRALDRATSKVERILFNDDNDMYSSEDMSIAASKLGHEIKTVFDGVFAAYYGADKFAYNENLCISILAATIGQFHSRLTARLLARKSIGDAESEVLAQFIDYALIETIPSPATELTNELRKTPAYHKLANIRTILTSRLNDILNQFYDGVFFDLETDELISLLHALFTDSPTRRSVIEEIKEIRSS